MDEMNENVVDEVEETNTYYEDEETAYEPQTSEPTVSEKKKSHKGAVAACIAAGVAGIFIARKLYKKHKAKKEAAARAETEDADEVDE